MAYSASPIDFDAGLACNGNNLSFYLGHLRRFAQDTSLVALSDALMQGNISQAFLLAHTLKGLSSQLAVTCVYLPAAELFTCCATEKPKICRRLRMCFSNCSPDLKKRRWRSSGTEFSVFHRQSVFSF